MLSVFVANARLLPSGRGQAGDHHLKFHDRRDNLRERVDQLETVEHDVLAAQIRLKPGVLDAG